MELSLKSWTFINFFHFRWCHPSHLLILFVVQLGFCFAHAQKKCSEIYSIKENPLQKILSKFEFPSEAEVQISDPLLRQAIYEVFGGRDFYTGQEIRFEEMRIDHIFPKSKGGPDNIYNYVPTSQRINGAKHSKTDAIGTESVLSIVRIAFAPKVLEYYLQLKSSKEMPSRMRRRNTAPPVPDIIYKIDFSELSPEFFEFAKQVQILLKESSQEVVQAIKNGNPIVLNNFNDSVGKAESIMDGSVYTISSIGNSNVRAVGRLIPSMKYTEKNGMIKDLQLTISKGLFNALFNSVRPIEEILKSRTTNKVEWQENDFLGEILVD